MNDEPWAVDDHKLLAQRHNVVAFFSLTQAMRGLMAQKLCVECKFRTRHTDLEYSRLACWDLSENGGIDH